MKLPVWLDEAEYKTDAEVKVRVRHLISMGASAKWPRSWYRKISHSISPLRQALVIELLDTPDEEMDHPEYFTEMRERFIDWLNDEDRTVMECPMKPVDWQLLRRYQNEMDSKIERAVKV